METKKIGKEEFEGVEEKIYKKDSLVFDGNIEIAGGMGTVTFRKKVSATGSILVRAGTNINVREEIEAGGDVTICGDVHVGKIYACGDIYAENMTAWHGEITAGGSLMVEKNIVAYKGDIFAGKKIHVEGNMQTGGDIYAENISVGEDMYAGGKITAGEDIGVGKNIEAIAEIEAGSMVVAGGDIKARNIMAGGDIRVDGKISTAEKIRNRKIKAGSANFLKKMLRREGRMKKIYNG